MVKPQWDVPATYTSEVRHQKSIASGIEKIAISMAFLLALISLVACSRYRRKSHFRSKTVIILAVIFYFLSLMQNWNAFHGDFLVQKQMQPNQTPMWTYLIGIGVISVLFAGLFVYWPLLAGKRLWDTSNYKELLPTW